MYSFINITNSFLINITVLTCTFHNLQMLNLSIKGVLTTYNERLLCYADKLDTLHSRSLRFVAVNY